MKTNLLHRAVAGILFFFITVSAGAQCTYYAASAGSNSAVTFSLAGGSFQSLGCVGADPTYWVAGSVGPMTATFTTPQNNPSFRVWGMNNEDVASINVNGSAYALNGSTASYSPKVVCGISPGPDGVIFSGNNVTGANDNNTGNWSFQDVTILASNVTTITINSISGAGWGFVGVGVNALSVSVNSLNTTCGNSNGSASVTVAGGNGPFTYLWSNGGTTDTIYNLATGIYTVTVNDGGNCSAVDTATVSGTGGNAITVTTDKTIMCSGDTATVCAPSGFVSYNWNTGQTGECIAAQVAGNYYVTATDAANCTVLSNPVQVSVYTSPQVSVTQTGDTLKGFDAVTYQWYLDNTLIQGANADVYVAEVSGTYNLVITDTNGCKSTSNPIVVTVSSITDLTAETAFTVYPNPLETGNWNLIAGTELTGSVFQIFDVNGRLVYAAEIRNRKTEIDLNAERGIYFFRIKTATQTLTQKLIKVQ